MRNKILSCISAVFVSVFISTISSQNAIAGGDLYVPAPLPEAEVRTKSGWSGFYFGGGIGLRKMSADVDVESENVFEKIEDQQKCNTVQTTKKFKKKVVVKKVKKVKTRCGYRTKTVYQKKYKTIYKKVFQQHCNCYKIITEQQKFDFNASNTVEGEWSAFGTAVVGYDYQFSDRFVAGLFADIDFGTSELDFNFSIDGGSKAANVAGNLKSDYAFTVGARLGYLIDDKTLAYGLVGYTRTSLSGQLTAEILDKSGAGYAPVSMSDSFSQDVGGLTLGVGAERKFGKNWSARFEYRYTMLDDISKTLSGSSSASSANYDPNDCKPGEWAANASSETTINMDPEIHSVRAVVSYRFNQ